MITAKRRHAAEEAAAQARHIADRARAALVLQERLAAGSPEAIRLAPMLLPYLVAS